MADSGIGIREEDMDRLFGTFAQVDKETNRGIEGTGLGLAITRNLASLMGGKIKVESEYGQGSVFTAEIPQLAPEPREPLAALNEPARNRSLFLEPDPLRAESLEWTLVRLGARYEIASGLDDFASALRGADGFAYFFAPEEEELAATAIATRAGTRIRPVWLSPPGAKGCRNPGALGSPFPLWCLPVARILNGEAGAGSHQARDRTEAAGLTAPSARVLLVDDLTVNLKVARGLLKPFQVEVDTCESGSEAVRLASEILYDIIFMDHVMPGMDGIEATERIRAAGNRVPVIALTANAVSGMREMFLCHGMNDFISKPIEIGRLEGILRQWLPPAKIVEPSAAPPPVAQAAPSPASAPAAAPAGRAAGPAPARGDHTAPGAAPPPAPADGGAGGRPGRDGGFDPAQSLSQLGGDQELLLEVLEMYVSSTPALLDRLRGIGPGEVVDSAKVFHSIKGSSLNVGARMVGEMAAALERAAKEGDGAAVLDGCQEFIETVEGLIWQMASFLRQATPGLQDPAVPEGH
ncbi:MAG: response regulator [Deltaproteobacteria bacterium]|nr:response regulator [Deltaproteobacteria bacterium]